MFRGFRASRRPGTSQELFYNNFGQDGMWEVGFQEDSPKQLQGFPKGGFCEGGKSP